MTPLRLIHYTVAMCKDQNLTPAQIKTKLTAVKSSALVNPDSPAREHDIAYYCDLLIAKIDGLIAAVPAYTDEQIREAVIGSITNVIPNQ